MIVAFAAIVCASTHLRQHIPPQDLQTAN